MFARIAPFLLLLVTGVAHAQANPPKENPEAPYDEQMPQRPAPPAEMCLVDGCNGVQVLNEQPIPVVVQPARRVPFRISASINGGAPSDAACGRITMERPYRIEFISGRVSLIAEGARSGLLIIAAYEDLDRRTIGPPHHIPLFPAGDRHVAGSAPLVFEGPAQTLSVCTLTAVSEGAIWGDVTISGFYEE